MNLMNRPLTWIAAGALAVVSLPAMALEPFKPSTWPATWACRPTAP